MAAFGHSSSKRVNEEIGKYYAVVKILFLTFQQCCLLQGDKTISPLGDDERSLLARGVNFIPTTPVTDKFQMKEDNEKFFKRLFFKLVKILKGKFQAHATSLTGLTPVLP